MNSHNLDTAFDDWFAALKGPQGSPDDATAVEKACVQVRRVVRKRIALTTWTPQLADIEDACQDALVNLCFRLDRWRTAGSRDDLPANPHGYLNTVARNACHDAIRKRHPVWFSMSARIQYLAAHGPKESDGTSPDTSDPDDSGQSPGGATHTHRPFTVWNHGDYHLCGFAGQTGMELTLDRSDAESILQRLPPRSWKSTPTGEIVAALLEAAEQPLPLEMLVDLVLTCTGVHKRDRSLSDEISPGITLLDSLANPDLNPEQELLLKDSKRCLWHEVCLLPRPQGRVSGLNLVAVIGFDLKDLLDAGIASLPEFKALIDPVPPSQLPENHWLPDRQIAELLLLTIRKVENLRGAARRRIARRCTKKPKRNPGARQDQAWFPVYGIRASPNDMTEHLTTAQILRFRARTLPIPEIFRVLEHTATCPDCQQLIQTAEPLTALPHSRREKVGAHLTYDDIEAFVDARFDAPDRAEIQAHIRACSTCAHDVEMIGSLRDELNRPLSELVAPRRAPPPRNLSRSAPRWAWPAGLGIAAVACAVAVLVISLSHRPQPAAQNSPQTASVQTHPDPALPADSLRDGERVISTSGGALSGLDGLSDTYRSAVTLALAGGQLQELFSLHPGRRTQAAALMGEAPTPGEAATAGKVRLLSPTGIVVQDQSPTFRWTRQPGAQYQVSVGDASFAQVASSGWIDTESWQIPVALSRGQTYSWQLKVRVHGKQMVVPAPPAPAARFQVLSSVQAAELDSLEARFGTSHLVMGVAFARHGVWEQAVTEFQELHGENPDSAAAARLLQEAQERVPPPER